MASKAASKVGKVGEKVGKKVGKKATKAFEKKPGPGPARIGDDVSRKGQQKKKGLQIHFCVKVRRVTQIEDQYCDKPVYVLYSNGKDRERNRVSSERMGVTRGIAIVPKEHASYDFDVILRPWEEEVGEDEVPWRPHPVFFSLRRERPMTDEEEEELRQKIAKQMEKKKKKPEKGGKNAPPEDTEDENVQELEKLLHSKMKTEIIGTKAQLDLATYAEDGCNITEAFGVAHPLPKKKKKKKKEDGSDPLEDDAPEEPPVAAVMAYKMMVSIQAKFVRYKGRMISKDLNQEGERVMIGREEWVYVEAPPESDEEDEYDEDDPLGIGLTEEEIQQLEPKVRDKLMKDLEKKEKARAKLLAEAEKEEDKLIRQEEKERERMIARQEQLAKEENRRRSQMDKEGDRKRDEELAADNARAEQAERELQDKEKHFEDSLGRELEADKLEAKRLEKERLRREKEEKKLASKKGSSPVSTPSRKSKVLSSSSNEQLSSKSTRAALAAAPVPMDLGGGGGPGPRMKITASVSIKFLEVTGCDRREGKMLYLAWRRGAKKENTGETSRAFCENGHADLADASPLHFTSTFQKSSKKQQFEEKPLSLALKEDSGKKGTLVGDVTVDLAMYAPKSTESFSRELDVPIQTKLGEKLTLRMLLEIVPEGAATLVADPLAMTKAPSAVPSNKKNLAKVRFVIQPRDVDKLDTSDPYIFIKWSRGAKKENSGQTRSIPCTLLPATFNDDETPMRITSSMEKKGNDQFHTKKLSLTLYSSKTADGSKAKSLGKVSINLADHAKHELKEEVATSFLSGKKTVATFTLIISASFTQYEGKRLTELPADTSRVNPQRIVEIEGNDYMLQTADDCSEMSEISNDSLEDPDSQDEVSEASRDVFAEEEPPIVPTRSQEKVTKSERSPSAPKPLPDQKEKEKPEKKSTERSISTSGSAAPPSHDDSEWKEKLGQSKKEVTRLQETLARVEAEKKESDKELKQMMADASESERLSALRTKLARLQDEEKDRAQLLAQQEKQLAEYQQMNQSLNNHKALLEEKLQKAVTAITAAQQKLTQLSAEAKKLKQENQEKEEQLAQYEARLADMQGAASRALKKNGGEKAQQLTAVFEQQLQVVRDQSQQNKERATAAHRECKQLEAQVASLTQQLAQAEESSGQGTVEDAQFFERVQCLHRNLLFAPRDFQADSRRPSVVVELAQYYAKHQDDLDVILELFQMITLMARNAGKDHHSLAYWLSVAIGLCAELQEEDVIEGKISEDGVQAPLTDLQAMSDVKEPSQLPNAMRLFIHEIYMLFITVIYDELDAHLEESFITTADLVMEDRVKFSDPNRSVDVTIRILEGALEAFVANKALPLLIQQAFAQFIYYISASLVNRIITTASYCRPQLGLQIKMGVSHLSSWLNQKAKDLPMVGTSSVQLKYAIEVSNVLTLATNESVFEEQYLPVTFPSLNLAQLRKIIELYSPDKFSPEPLPATVKRLINNACQREPGLRAMPLELEPTLPLAEAKGEENVDEEDGEYGEEEYGEDDDEYSM